MFTSIGFEAPALARTLLPFPPLAARVAVAAGQMVRYAKQLGLTKRELKHFHRVFKAPRGLQHLEAAHAQKVKGIFQALLCYGGLR